MIKHILASAILVTALSGGVVLAQTIENSYYETTQRQQSVLAVEKQLEEDVSKAQAYTTLFVESLVTISLETTFQSTKAQNLDQLFMDAVGAINALEESGGIAYATPYRDQIQDAFATHMERPGAMEALISQNINAYSTYLTETLIAQADVQAEI